MNRRVLRYGAVMGAVTVSMLAIAPVFAATTVSQAGAQSLVLSIAGNSIVSQEVTATNDGDAQTKNDASTVPTLASLIPGNNAIGVGVAPQDAGANADGTSFACAGLAGTGGGIAKVGNSSCDIDGAPLTLNLATLDLDLTNLLGAGALTGPLGDALSGVLLPVGTVLDDIVSQLTTALAGTPLGDLSIGGSLSAIQSTCVANPTAATGDSGLARPGSDTVPIGITLPGGTVVNLVNLPVNPPVNFKPVTNPLDLVDLLVGPNGAIKDELDTALGGALAGLGPVLDALLTPLKAALLAPVLDALAPVFDALEENILDITMNKQVVSEGGRKIEITALELDVLPAAAAFVGASLVKGEIGKVTCGPNTAKVVPPTEPTDDPTPEVPTVVDSGVRGPADNTALNVLVATGALMALAGTAGLIGYRRMLVK